MICNRKPALAVIFLIFGILYSYVFIRYLLPETNTFGVNNDAGMIRNDYIYSDLFCKPEMLKDNEINFLENIYSIQYPSTSCDDVNIKYYVMSDPEFCEMGLMASISCYLFYFAQAILNNRVFIIDYREGNDGFRYQWALNKYCKKMNKYGNRECYFEKISKCSDYVFNVLKNNRSMVYQHNPYSYKQKKKIEKDFDPFSDKYYNDIQYRIIEVKNWYINCFKRENTKVNINIFARKFNIRPEFGYMALVSYLLRLNSVTNNQVNLNLDNILSEYNFKMNRSIESVSLMIRWGDKCLGKWNRIEMDCYDVKEYISVLRQLFEINKRIRYIILTTESQEVISNFTKVFNEYKTNTKYGFNDKILILNKNDIMQGYGTIQTERKNSEDNLFDKHQIMMSMLTNIKLHFISNIYFVKTGSHWNHFIYKLSKYINCSPYNNKTFYHHNKYKSLIILDSNVYIWDHHNKNRQTNDKTIIWDKIYSNINHHPINGLNIKSIWDTNPNPVLTECVS